MFLSTVRVSEMTLDLQSGVFFCQEVWERRGEFGSTRVLYLCIKCSKPALFPGGTWEGPGRDPGGTWVTMGQQ